MVLAPVAGVPGLEALSTAEQDAGQQAQDTLATFASKLSQLATRAAPSQTGALGPVGPAPQPSGGGGILGSLSHLASGIPSLVGEAAQSSLFGSRPPQGQPASIQGNPMGESGIPAVMGAPQEAVRAIPGEQSLPAPVRAVAEQLPYAALPGGDLSIAARLGLAGISGLGGYGAQQGAAALGASPEIQQLASLGGQLAAPLAAFHAAPLAEQAGELPLGYGPQGEPLTAREALIGEAGGIKLPGWATRGWKPAERPLEQAGRPQEPMPGEHPPAFDEQGNPVPGFNARGVPQTPAAQGEQLSSGTQGERGPWAGGQQLPADDPVNKVRGLITMAEPLPAETEAVRSQVRSQREAMAQQAKAAALAANPEDPEAALQAARNMRFQTGAMGKTAFPDISVNFSPTERASLFQKINDAVDNGTLKGWEDSNAYEALKTLMTGQVSDMQLNQIRLLDKVFGPDAGIGDAILKKQAEVSGIKPQWQDYAVSLYHTPSKFLTYLHGIYLKQGFGEAAQPQNWSTARQAIRDGFNAWRDPAMQQFVRERNGELNFIGADNEAYKSYQPSSWKLSTERQPGFIEKATGLGRAAIETPIDVGVNKIPGMVGSQRNMTTYLSSLRDMLYNREAQAMYDNGERDPAAFKQLYEQKSHATGHGDPFGNPGATPLFSWQAFTGRWKSMTDPLTKQGPARQAAIRNLLTIFGVSAATTELAKALGVPTTIASVGSPLGTVKLGYTSIQPSAGYNSIVKLTEKMGQALAAAGGNAVGVDLGPTIGAQGLQQITSQYLRGQLGPTTDLGLNLVTGQDWKGAKYNLLDQAKRNALADLWAPIGAREIWDAVRANGPVGALEAAPALGAETVSTNVPTADQRNKEAQNRGLADYASATTQQKKEINDAIGYEPTTRAQLQFNDVAKADEAVRRYAAYQAPDAWVQYKNFKRALNESAGSEQAWSDSKDLFAREDAWTQANIPAAAQSMYKKPMDQLTQGEQNRVIGALHQKAREDNPTLDAYLAYFRGEQDVRSTAAGNIFSELNKKYKGTDTIPLAKGAK